MAVEHQAAVDERSRLSVDVAQRLPHRRVLADADVSLVSRCGESTQHAVDWISILRICPSFSE